MTALAVLLTLAAAAGVDPDLLPPQPEPERERPMPRGALPAIFTYAVDERCRVVRVRKLQGSPDVSWDDVQQAMTIAAEDTVWRYVDGARRQLRERRVKLLGEMIREGELVCLVLPSGDVLEAWVERTDAGSARRRAPVREPLTVQDGTIESPGTFSLEASMFRSAS